MMSRPAVAAKTIASVRIAWLIAAYLVLAACGAADDAAYRAQFLAAFPAVEPPAALEAYATAERFDALYLGAGWEAALEGVHNDSGGIAWGTSYLMMAFNTMFEATGDAKYLEANRTAIRAVLAATDAKRGKTLGDGRSVPAWGCEAYSAAGRAAHAVHTGIIAAPIADFLRLSAKHADFRAALGAEYDAMAAAILDALAVHDAQWRDGPEPEAGHYQAAAADDGKGEGPLPGNWQSAMGWAWYRIGQALGREDGVARALRIGRYLRNRLCAAPDGAFYWAYYLPAGPVATPCPGDSLEAEDTSHAALTMALPFALGGDGALFAPADLARLARTVTEGFAPAPDGLLYPRIDGRAGLDPAAYLGFPSRWLWLARHEPAVADRILPFYLRHRATPAPLELADLVLYARARDGAAAR